MVLSYAPVVVANREYDESSSELSVAEERDTITATPNAATPNLSRIMNICSISKIEQYSIDSKNM